MTTQAAERLARRIAREWGYELRKSRRRKPAAPDYGLYNLFDPNTGGAVLPQNDAILSPFNWSLKQVMEWIYGRSADQHRSTLRRQKESRRGRRTAGV